MTSQRLLKLTLALVAGLTLSACGGKEPEEGESGETGPLLPMAEGNVWEYRVTDGDMISQKRTTVFAKEAVGGPGPNAAVMAFKVVTRKGADVNVEAGLDKTESWQGPEDGAPERLIRYRELSYGAMTQMLQLEEYWVPPRIRVDSTAERTKIDVSWIERYKETKIAADEPAPVTSNENDLWRVLSGDETVTVPAGTFEHTVHLQKTSDSTSSKEYWFARNVGKVKETGASQTEELTKYTLNNGATP